MQPIDECRHIVYQFIKINIYYSTLYCKVPNALYISLPFINKPMKKILSFLCLFVFLAHETYSLGFPIRLYPAKAIKKSIHFMVKKVKNT